MPPKVTVLMAIHNEERFLRAAIDSILRQTFTDFELLIVDDASTDRSATIASRTSDPRVRFFRIARHRGLTASLNFGLRLIHSEYVARLDGNDLALPNRLERQVAWLDAHPEIGALGTQAIMINARGRRIRRVHLHPQWSRPAGGVELEWYRMFDTPFTHSAVMFRRKLATRLRGYDERQPLCHDADLWMRMGQIAGLANLAETLTAYRFLRYSMTMDPSRHERRRYAVLRTPSVYSLLRQGLQWDDVPKAWAFLWAQTADPTTKSIDGLAVMEMTESCANRFFEIHPEARGNRRIARHRVSMLARIISRSPRNTRARLFRAMLRLDLVATLLMMPSLAKALLSRALARAPKAAHHQSPAVLAK